MKIKVLLCNCKGLCDSFKQNDFNTLPFQVESDLDVQYSILHPQLCGQGGNGVLIDVLKNADSETHVLCGACAPAAQEKLFKKILRTTGFPAERFVPVDIRMTDNDGVMARLREKVEEILRKASPKKAETAAAEVPDGELPTCTCSGLVPEEEEQRVS